MPSAAKQPFAEGYYFRKQFFSGLFIGKVVRVRKNAKDRKTRRVLYTDNDFEDLTTYDLECLLKANGPVTTQEMRSWDLFWTKREKQGIRDGLDDDRPATPPAQTWDEEGEEWDGSGGDEDEVSHNGKRRLLDSERSGRQFEATKARDARKAARRRVSDEPEVTHRSRTSSPSPSSSSKPDMDFSSADKDESDSDPESSLESMSPFMLLPVVDRVGLFVTLSNRPHLLLRVLPNLPSPSKPSSKPSSRVPSPLPSDSVAASLLSELKVGSYAKASGVQEAQHHLASFSVSEYVMHGAGLTPCVIVGPASGRNGDDESLFEGAIVCVRSKYLRIVGDLSSEQLVRLGIYPPPNANSTAADTLQRPVALSHSRAQDAKGAEKESSRSSARRVLPGDPSSLRINIPTSSSTSSASSSSSSSSSSSLAVIAATSLPPTAAMQSPTIKPLVRVSPELHDASTATAPNFSPPPLEQRVSLSSVPSEQRFGLHVFHTTKQRQSGAGQVFCISKGWVEVLYEGGKLVKDRADAFFLADPADAGVLRAPPINPSHNAYSAAPSPSSLYAEQASLRASAPPAATRASSSFDKPAERFPSPLKYVPPNVTALWGGGRKELSSNAFFWSCGSCTVSNRHKKKICSVCSTPLYDCFDSTTSSSASSSTANSKRDKQSSSLYNPSKWHTLSPALSQALQLVREFHNSGQHFLPPDRISPSTDSLSVQAIASEYFKAATVKFYESLALSKVLCSKVSYLDDDDDPRDAQEGGRVISYSVFTDLFICKSRRKNGERCAKPCADGYDFCASHQTFKESSSAPSFAARKNSGIVDIPPTTFHGAASASAFSASKSSQKPALDPTASSHQLLARVTSQLTATDMSSIAFDRKSYSIEDDILLNDCCHAELPLGLRSRKFFEGYGYFDSRIVYVHRAACNVLCDKGSFEDVEYVYRCRYVDGDEEDLTYRQIMSLHQLYDTRNVLEKEKSSGQFKLGLNFTLLNGAVGEIVATIDVINSVVIRWKGGSSFSNRVDPQLSMSLFVGDAGTFRVVDIIDLQLNIRQAWLEDDPIGKRVSWKYPVFRPRSDAPSKLRRADHQQIEPQSSKFVEIVGQFLDEFVRWKAKQGMMPAIYSTTDAELNSTITRAIKLVEVKGGVFKYEDELTKELKPMPVDSIRRKVFKCLLKLSSESIKPASAATVSSSSSSSSSSVLARAVESEFAPHQKFDAIHGVRREFLAPSNLRRPLLEWPRRKIVVSEQLEGTGISKFPVEIGEPVDRPADAAAGRHKVAPGLWLTDWVASDDEHDLSDSSSSEDEGVHASARRKGIASEEDGKRRSQGSLKGPLSHMRGSPTAVVKRGLPRRPATIWDPCNVLPHLRWDPFGELVCDVCKKGQDDDRILLCDKCAKGFHLYCLRPVLVNVPIGEWMCATCNPKVAVKAESFDTQVTKMLESQADQRKVATWLGLPNCLIPSDFFSVHKELFAFLNEDPRARRTRFKNNLRGNFWELEGLYLTHKPVSTVWSLPISLKSKREYSEMLTKMYLAMVNTGMEKYSDDLIYTNKATREMNDALLDTVDKMSESNIKVFKHFKANCSKGLVPPLMVTYNEIEGFTVEAMQDIEKTTLLCEYCGVVTRISDSGDTDSDSLMVLLQTDDPKTSLIIDPNRRGNIARFLSGVNNSSWESRKKINVRTRRFAVDGECRVVLFSDRKILKGEKLHYDYNAGMIGKEDAEWIDKGFYDTSFFV